MGCTIVLHVVTIVLYGMTPDDPKNIFSMFRIDPSLTIVSYVFSAVFIILGIYLVIWSRQHNKQFDQPTTQTEAP